MEELKTIFPNLLWFNAPAEYNKSNQKMKQKVSEALSNCLLLSSEDIV